MPALMTVISVSRVGKDLKGRAVSKQQQCYCGAGPARSRKTHRFAP